jgi:hypothetical protein
MASYPALALIAVRTDLVGKDTMILLPASAG